MARILSVAIITSFPLIALFVHVQLSEIPSYSSILVNAQCRVWVVNWCFSSTVLTLARFFQPPLGQLCWLLPAPAGFCRPCWLLPAPGEGKSCEKGCVYSCGPRSDLDRTSVGSRLIMQKSGLSKHCWACSRWSWICFHIALPEGLVPPHPARICLVKMLRN